MHDKVQRGGRGDRVGRDVDMCGEQVHTKHMPFYMARDENLVGGCAGDETLRFWNVFPGQRSQGSVNDSSIGSLLRTQIR